MSKTDLTEERLMSARDFVEHVRAVGKICELIAVRHMDMVTGNINMKLTKEQDEILQEFCFAYLRACGSLLEVSEVVEVRI